jgi:3-hydroxyacyl-CoA dehydrogenase / enoyl-CoA hydratase / 3-hydroxybutyryl-CoA epimerase
VTTELETIRYDRDADGVVTLTMDDPTQRANTMRARFGQDLGEVVRRLRAEHDLTGVILTSGSRRSSPAGTSRS